MLPSIKFLSFNFHRCMGTGKSLLNMHFNFMVLNVKWFCQTKLYASTLHSIASKTTSFVCCSVECANGLTVCLHFFFLLHISINVACVRFNWLSFLWYRLDWMLKNKIIDQRHEKVFGSPTITADVLAVFVNHFLVHCVLIHHVQLFELILSTNGKMRKSTLLYYL